MRRIRIIPRLDIKGPNLVKGIHLEGLRVLGQPNAFAKIYYEQGADELIFIDVVASLYERNNLHSMIEIAARDIFIPITVGGGIRTLDDIYRLLRSGADKVSINTAAIKRPKFIQEASKEFGASTIVATIEAIKQENGKYLAYTDNGREYTGKDVFEWAKELEDLGAGEILMTSVDREGTGQGFDLDLIATITKTVKIPVIVHGGPGKMEHIQQLAQSEVPFNGVAIASMLHYGIFQELAKGSGQGTLAGEGNREFIGSGKDFSRITPSPLKEIKETFTQYGLISRAVEDKGFQ